MFSINRFRNQNHAQCTTHYVALATFIRTFMERNAWFYRFFFIVISCIIGIAYQCSLAQGDTTLSCTIAGALRGLAVFLIAMGIELGVKHINLRSLNTVILGLATGALLGYVLTATLKNVLSLLFLHPFEENLGFLFIALYLGCIYFGIMAVSSMQENFWLNIPFIRLTPAAQSNKKEILMDMSALEDARLLELARSGILDHELVLPTFLLKELQKGLDSQDEGIRSRSHKCQEHLKRLESIPQLALQQKEFHFQDQEDIVSKLIKAARLIQGYIITSEPSLYRLEEEGPTVINLESIAISLKPGMQRGETLAIKIQRLGKEPKQGVGYLEDGTMVVVNGGGEFLGQTVKTQVLSQKYSTSGKIIFCNAITDDKNGGRSQMPSFETSQYQQFTYSGN